METKSYVIIFEDCSLKIVSEIDDDLKQSAFNGYVQIIDITGAKDLRKMVFPTGLFFAGFEWQSIDADSKNSD